MKSAYAIALLAAQLSTSAFATEVQEIPFNQVIQKLTDQVLWNYQQGLDWVRISDGKVGRREKGCFYLARAAGTIDISNELTDLDSIIEQNPDEASKIVERITLTTYQQFATTAYAAYKGYCERGTDASLNNEWLENTVSGVRAKGEQVRTLISYSPAKRGSMIPYLPLIIKGHQVAQTAMNTHTRLSAGAPSEHYDFCGKSKGAMNTLMSLSAQGEETLLQRRIKEVNDRVNSLTDSQRAAFNHRGACGTGMRFECESLDNADDVVYRCVDRGWSIFHRELFIAPLMEQLGFNIQLSTPAPTPSE